jgi:hypothetical protein
LKQRVGRDFHKIAFDIMFKGLSQVRGDPVQDSRIDLCRSSKRSMQRLIAANDLFDLFCNRLE